MKALKIILVLFFCAALVPTAMAQSSGQSAGAEMRFNGQRLEINKPVELYPNPVVEVLNVQLNDEALQNVSFRLYNIIGNEIKIRVEEQGDQKFRIPVKDLESGYYLLIISDENARFRQTFKFAKDE